MKRRHFLATTAPATLLGTASCLSSLSGREVDGEIRPDYDPEVIPVALACDEEGVSRHNRVIRDDVQWGGTDEFALWVERLSYAYGETANITLTHTSSGQAATGSSLKFLFQLYTKNGWQDVRVTPEDSSGIAPPDERLHHDSTEIFTWSLELTESGLETAPFESIVTVCPDLLAGRYRFLYYGLDKPVAVAFDLQRETTQRR